MQCDKEDAGYGESVARLNGLIEALKGELLETQALALRLADIANFKRVKVTSSRELLEMQVEMIRIRHRERRHVACAEALATARERVRYSKRKIRAIESAGGVPPVKLLASLERRRKRVRLIKRSDPLKTTLY